MLAGAKYIDNANGTNSINTDGTATDVILRGVGKVELNDGTFPEYDLDVTISSQTLTKVN
jgi:hypothetical protein